MVDFKELRSILNGAGMSIRKYSQGKVAVTDSAVFRGAKLSALEEAQSLVAEATYNDVVSYSQKLGIKQVDSVRDVNDRARRNIGMVIDCLAQGKDVTAQEMRRRMSSPTAIRDSIINPRWNNNTLEDPTRMNVAFPNVYISPWEASALYSQKGLFETVINKKSKSILLNGIRIENPRLSARQLDAVNERLETLDIKHHISDSVRDSLVYGGGLVFPLFKKDTPVTTQMSLGALLKLGVLGKDCIDFFCKIDRWNCFIIPPYNPTQKDFYRPDVYTVPFLGSDVHHARCARVVTAEQAGYWGNVINQGWGISDLCGYLQSGMNYKVAVQSLPLMIQQMSILARVVNVDGMLATEGSNALDALVEQDTIRTREASPDNPVTMDILGDLKSIDRNFGQVPELIRLLRQDFASDCTIPEPMLFSSEKGNFASGDDTEGNQSKQWEAVKMIHKDTERQFTQIAKILVIDALGTGDDVMRSLPLTKIHFDEPVIANALERAQIGKNYSENVFNLVSAQVPIDIAVEMASRHVSSDMAVSSDVLERLRRIQENTDRQDEERFRMEMAQQRASVEAAEASAERSDGSRQRGAAKPKSAVSGGERTKGKSSAEEQKEKALADKEEKGYSRLEQKEHEKARLGTSKRREAKSKAEGKSVKRK